MTASPLSTHCIYKERAEDTGQGISKGGKKAARDFKVYLGSSGEWGMS